MRRETLPLLLLLASASVGPLQAEERRWWLGAEEWSHPRSGSSLLAMEPLRRAVRAWMAREGQRLIVRYPGGEEGMMWAAELRGWLVALGITSRSIELSPGSARGDAIALEVVE
jgi:hypothetical protein